MQQLANLAQSTLAADYTAGDTSIDLATGTGALFPSTGNFTLAFATSLVDDTPSFFLLCTARSSDTLTVSALGQEGTTAADRVTGVKVTQVISRDSLRGLLNDYCGVGTFALRPTGSGFIGQRYKCTDSPYEFIYDGSLWQPFLRGVPAGPIVVTGQTTTQGTNGGGSINSSATSVEMSAQFASMPATPFYVQAGTELIKVTAAASTTWTIARGQNGTTAASHTDGDTWTEQLWIKALWSANSVYLNSGGILVIDEQATIGSNDGGTKMVTKLAYSAPYTVILMVGGAYLYSTNYLSIGVCWWDIANVGKDVRITACLFDGSWKGPTPIQSWAGAGNFAGNISGGTPNTIYGQNNFTAQSSIPGAPLYVKLVDDNTNWLAYFSFDRVNWFAAGIAPRNTTITATHIGAFASARGARCGVELLSCEQFSGVV